MKYGEIHDELSGFLKACQITSGERPSRERIAGKLRSFAERIRHDGQAGDLFGGGSRVAGVDYKKPFMSSVEQAFKLHYRLDRAVVALKRSIDLRDPKGVKNHLHDITQLAKQINKQLV